MKKYQQEKTNRNCGYFCSKECFNEYKKIWFCGKNNHQYGLKGKLNPTFKDENLTHENHNLKETLVFCPNHPYAERGRITRHRLVVEQNHQLFDDSFFERINGLFVLKKGLIVHHKDGDHTNDDITNLEIMSRGEHSALHCKLNPQPRNKKTGRFVKRINN